MKKIEWNSEKNDWLIATRGVSFEECLDLISRDKFLDIIKNKSPYTNQKIFILRIRNYIHIVPFVEDDEKIFLKTIIPHSKLNKKYEKNK